MPRAIASYLPESLLIHAGPDLQLFAENPEDHEPPTPAALGFFFHEYCHYLHNVSTFSGMAAWINTIELWRLFRRTFSTDGWSGGSALLDDSHRQHLGTLLGYLAAARHNPAPTFKRIASPESLRFIALAPETAASGPQGALLTAMTGEADVRDHAGEVERVRVQLGTLELF